MILLRLLPDQVMTYWDEIKQHISLALPPYVANDTQSMLHIQEELLNGLLDCWICAEDVKMVNVYGIATTKFIADPVSRTKNMLVYTVNTVSVHPRDLWQLCRDKFSAYAKSYGCSNILAYSNNPTMLDIAERLGADTSYRLVMFTLPS